MYKKTESLLAENFGQILSLKKAKRQDLVYERSD